MITVGLEKAPPINSSKIKIKAQNLMYEYLGSIFVIKKLSQNQKYTNYIKNTIV